MDERGFWWCPVCKYEVLPQNVTFSEHHDNCGARVEWIDIKTASMVTELQEQLATANAELAAAVKKVEDFDLVVVMNKKICSELDAAKARVAAYKKALDIAMSTNQSHETYCKVEAALEGKP